MLAALLQLSDHIQGSSFPSLFGFDLSSNVDVLSWEQEQEQAFGPQIVVYG